MLMIDPSNSRCQFIIGDSEPFFIGLYSLTVLLKLPHQELEDLIKKIKTRLNLSQEAEEFLYSISKEKTLPKGEVLIRQGQVVKNTFFVTGLTTFIKVWIVTNSILTTLNYVQV